MIDVSVIVPSFNRLWSLPQAVESCRNSTCRTEIIVVDDGSTDGTWAWLAAQPDVVAIRQDNWGKDWAVNRGLAAAQGEYIRFLDSDDWLSSGANDGQLVLARSTGADVVVAGYRQVDEMANTISEHPWIDCDDFIAQQLGEVSSSHYSAYLFRKAFVADIPHRQEFGAKDDRMYVIEVALKRPSVAIFNTPVLMHRHHAQERLQFSRGMRAIANNLYLKNVVEKALTLLENRGELNLRRKRAAIRLLWPLAHWIGYTHLDEACEVAHRIFAMDPEFQPPEHGILGWCYRNIGFRGTQNILKIRRQALTIGGMLRRDKSADRRKWA